jgi:hypothetical protein
MTQQLKNDKRRRARDRTLVVLLLSCCCACTPKGQKSEPGQQRQEAPGQILTAKKNLTAKKSKSTRTLHPTPSRCPAFLPPKKNGRVQNGPLSEISGIAASDQHADVFWVHNDSGGRNRLYALSGSGELLRTFQLDIKSQDWEDIALSTRPGRRDYLYIADTGDNLSEREKGVEIHRIKEPRQIHPNDEKERKKVERIKKVDTMKLSFPDSPHDSEALLVDPWTDQIVLITKEKMGWPKIYSVDEFQDEAVLAFEGTITPSTAKATIHLVTGGDVSFDGHWIILRTYLGVYLFFRETSQTVSEALARPACQLQAPIELQGEAIAFSRAAIETDPAAARPKVPAFYTLSEGTGVDLFKSTPKPFGTAARQEK